MIIICVPQNIQSHAGGAKGRFKTAQQSRWRLKLPTSTQGQNNWTKEQAEGALEPSRPHSY